MSTRPLHVLIEKTSDWDKDERYMATNDLCSILSKDQKLTEEMEKKICAAVLKQLDDPSNDVQSVAVKCLSIVLKKVKQAQIGEVCTKLCSLILDGGKDALRDIYSIALRGLITDVPESMGSLVTDLLTSRLLSGMVRAASDDIKRECIDNMTELLKRFGHLNEADHVDIMNIVTKQLEDEKVVIRKRSATCVGALAVVSSDALLNQLVAALLDHIALSEGKSAIHTRVLIQTIGIISRTVGYRLGRHLSRIVPLFLRFCGDASDENQQTDEANELRESCFPGLESFVHTCPKEVEEFLPQILAVSLSFVKFDPNYSYDDDDDDVSGDGAMILSGDSDGGCDDGEEEEAYEDEEDYGDYDDYGGGSDDDDTSWKVRKAAVKVIHAAVSSRPEMVRYLVDTCAAPMLNRFKEREENVRVDVINCFTLLIQKAYRTDGSGPAAAAAGAAVDDENVIAAVPLPLSRQSSSGTDLMDVLVPRIINQSYKHLIQTGPASIKTKSALFTLLRQLVLARQGGLESYLEKLLRSSEKSLEDDKNQSLKLDALSFIREALTHHSSAACTPLLPFLVPIMVSAVSDDWYKIIAEALRLAGAIVLILSRNNEDGSSVSSSSPYVVPVYNAVYSRLVEVDIDQEIKESSLSAMGVLLSQLGNHTHLVQQLPAVLSIIQKRLDNETTRITALKTLTQIASSPLNSDLRSFFESTGCNIAVFVRPTHLSNRLLKQSALQCLAAMLLSRSTLVTKRLADELLKDVSSCLTDADIHLCQLGLKVCACILGSEQESSEAAAEAFHAHVYPHLLQLARSSLLHGSALHYLVSLFQQLLGPAGQGVCSSLSFGVIFQDLYSAQDVSQLSKLSISNLSKCIAGLCYSTPALSEGAALQFAKDIQAASSTTATSTTSTSSADASAQKRLQLSLLCLGEVGQHFDLLSCSAGGTAEQWMLCVQGCFSSSNEDTKMCAAYALGHMTVGNMSAFLPYVLGDGSGGEPSSSAAAAAATATTISGGQHHYLLLAALKEVILVHASGAAVSSPSSSSFRAYEAAILPVLLKQCESMSSSSSSSSSSTAVGAEVAADGSSSSLDRGATNGIDDSVRTMVAECLGALMSISPSVVPLLCNLFNSSTGGGSSRGTRHMVALTLRFAVVRCSTNTSSNNSSSYSNSSVRSGGAGGDGSAAAAAATTAGFHAAATTALAKVGLTSAVTSQFLLPLLQDEDLDVKRAALMLTNTAVHHCPDLVIEQLRESIIPILLETLRIKLERTVDLGPFKHKVDDNLSLRKIALSCIETILDVCPQKLDVSLTMGIMPTILMDKDEIKLQTHQIIAKLRTYSPGAVLGMIELLIEPLEKSIMKKPPKGAEETAADNGSSSALAAGKVGTAAGANNPEQERAMELVRSAVRCALSLNRLDDASAVSSRKWAEFIDRIKKVEHIAAIIEGLQEDRAFD